MLPVAVWAAFRSRVNFGVSGIGETVEGIFYSLDLLVQSGLWMICERDDEHMAFRLSGIRRTAYQKT